MVNSLDSSPDGNRDYAGWKPKVDALFLYAEQTGLGPRGLAHATGVNWKIIADYKSGRLQDLPPDAIGKLCGYHSYLGITPSSRPLAFEDGMGIDEWPRIHAFYEHAGYGNVMMDEVRTGVERSLAQLSPRQRSVIILRYGIYDGEQNKLTTIGRIFNVSETDIRLIEKRALNRLRISGRLKSLWEEV